MGSYKAIKGQTLTIDLLEDSRDNGWVISGNKAIHSGCNPGFIELKLSTYTVGVPNKFEYLVTDYKSGIVQLYVGSTTGAARSANSPVDVPYVDIITPSTNDKVKFYATGDVTLTFFAISPVKAEGVNNGVTFGFYEHENKWGGNFSYLPENMIRFVNAFYTFKNGELWKHNTNPLRNNFYGQQFESVITFYATGQDVEMIKNFINMEINSNEVWSSPKNEDIRIFPIKGKKNGMLSRLKKDRFNNIQGVWFADFLKNLIDPRFGSENEALWNGADLQGQIMELTIRNTNTTDVRLVSVSVMFNEQNYTT